MLRLALILNLHSQISGEGQLLVYVSLNMFAILLWLLASEDFMAPAVTFISLSVTLVRLLYRFCWAPVLPTVDSTSVS